MGLTFLLPPPPEAPVAPLLPPPEGLVPPPRPALKRGEGNAVENGPGLQFCIPLLRLELMRAGISSSTFSNASFSFFMTSCATLMASTTAPAALSCANNRKEGRGGSWVSGDGRGP